MLKTVAKYEGKPVTPGLMRCIASIFKKSKKAWDFSRPF